MRTVAVIQARFDSSRLPGKALMDLGGMPVLAWLVRAVDAAPGIDHAVIATSDETSDDPIADWCHQSGIRYYRGPKHDVLRRFAIAVEGEGADVALRLTGDCPFHDPQVLGGAVALRKLRAADYVSSAHPESWPDGLDCEVFTREALMAADREAKRPSERESVTRFFRFRRPRFVVETYACPLPGLTGERWTLDYPEDLAFMQAVIAEMGIDRPFSYLDILALLDRKPELRAINKDGVHNLGVTQVMDEDVRTGAFFVHDSTQADKISGRKTTASDAPVLTFGLRGHAWDVDGNEFVDLDSGPSPLLFGHAWPEVNQEINRALQEGITLPYAGYSRQMAAEKIQACFRKAEDCLFFGSTLEAAITMAAALPRITGRSRYAIFGPADMCRFWSSLQDGCLASDVGNDIDTFLATLDRSGSDLSHCLVLPLADRQVAPGFFARLKDILNRHNILLVIDEQQTALHCGVGGGSAMFGLEPDLYVLGANIANGLGLTTITGDKSLVAEIDGSRQVVAGMDRQRSISGEQIVFAAANKVLDEVMEKNPTALVTATGDEVIKRVGQLVAETAWNEKLKISGPGCLPRIEMSGEDAETNRERLRLALRENGVLVSRHMALCVAHGSADISAITEGWRRSLVILQETAPGP
jgi:glutamate-1-semialdehyde 2,1-aminomutase